MVNIETQRSIVYSQLAASAEESDDSHRHRRGAPQRLRASPPSQEQLSCLFLRQLTPSMQSTRARRRSNACLEHLQRPSCSPASFACCTRSLFKPCRSVGIVSLAERKTSKRRLGKELPESADTAMAGEHESQTTSTSTSHRHFRIAHKEIRNRSRSSDNMHNLADPGVACTCVIDRRVDLRVDLRVRARA